MRKRIKDRFDWDGIRYILFHVSWITLVVIVLYAFDFI